MSPKGSVGRGKKSNDGASSPTLTYSKSPSIGPTSSDTYSSIRSFSIPKIPPLISSVNASSSSRYFSRPMTLEEWQGQLWAREWMLKARLKECEQQE